MSSVLSSSAVIFSAVNLQSRVECLILTLKIIEKLVSFLAYKQCAQRTPRSSASSVQIALLFHCNSAACVAIPLQFCSLRCYSAASCRLRCCYLHSAELRCSLPRICSQTLQRRAAQRHSHRVLHGGAWMCTVRMACIAIF
jgi:hypothetical protein